MQLKLLGRVQILNVVMGVLWIIRRVFASVHPDSQAHFVTVKSVEVGPNILLNQQHPNISNNVVHKGFFFTYRPAT